MTVVQLAQRLVTRNLTVGQLSLLPGDGQLGVTDAINGALTDFYDLAPPQYRRAPIAFTLPAPVIIPGVKPVPGANTLLAPAFDPGSLECTVRLDGDAHWNSVAGPSALLDTYQGADPGSAGLNATVYGDAARLGAGLFRSLTGDPHLIRGEMQIPLVRDEGLRERRPQRIGQPEVYCLAPSSLPAGGALVTLRVEPLPAIACRIRLEADLQPIQFSAGDLDRAIDLPVPDHLCTTILMGLAQAHLHETCRRYWIEGRNAPDPSRANEALARLPTDAGAPNHFVGTPAGF